MYHARSRFIPRRIVVLALGLLLAVPGSRLRGEPRLAPTGVVIGTVVDVSGQGVADASVYVETDPARLSETLRATTDESGAFEIRGVPAGLVRLRVVHPSYTAGGLPEVEVDPVRGPLPVTIVLRQGARAEGHVYLRDGRPFASGWVIVTTASPEYDYGWPVPAALGEDGSFAVAHLVPGQGLVHVMALNPHAAPPFAGEDTKTLSPIVQQPIELREAETTAVDLTLHDVVLSGRISRHGEAAPGVRVSVSPGSSHSISFSGLTDLPAAGGIPALEATTDADGGYELLVFRPGAARVSFALPGGDVLPPRHVTVPDTAAFTFDADLTAAAVSGVVVDEETGAPLPYVSLRLTKLGEGLTQGVRSDSRRDGTFAIGAEEGRYLLRAEQLGHVPVVRELTVGSEGVEGLRLEMGRGRSIQGRVADQSGGPASGQAVIAVGPDGFERAVVESDGHFRLQGLGEGPYTLSVGTTLSGFAIRTGVTPGPEPVLLTLRPAGKVALRVVTRAGRPVADAMPRIVFVDRGPVTLPGVMPRPTDEDGRTEIDCPAGDVGIGVSSAVGGGFAFVTVRPGETSDLEVELSAE